MSVRRRKYCRDGKQLTSRFYNVRFTAPDGQLIRRTTKCTGRRAAERAEQELRAQIECGQVGIIDSKEAHRPIMDQIDLFVSYLSDQLHRDSMYCYTAGQRLKRMAAEAGWRRISDISLSSYEDWRQDAAKMKWRGRLPKPKTLNQFLDIARRFLGWACQMGKVKQNPLKNAEKARVIDNPTYRRAATKDEMVRLLASVPAERARFYRFVLYVPLRRATIKQLVWGDLHLDAAQPWIAIRGETSKSREFERSPVRREIADDLKDMRGKAKDSELVFEHVPTAEEIEEDLIGAGLSFKDTNGNRRLDLHAFRKTAIKWMKDAGVPLEQAALILHHKDIRTTRKYYNEEPDPVTINAVDKMPLI